MVTHLRRYHVVALTRDVERAIAVRRADGWRLPRLQPSRTITPAARLDAEFGGCADLLWIAPLSADFAANIYSCAAILKCPFDAASITMSLVAVKELLSENMLSEPDRLALTTALARMQAPAAPFDSEGQCSAALAWAERQLARTGARLVSTHKHRCNRYERILRLTTTADAMWLKGGPDIVNEEAELTHLLESIAPARFPTTLARSDRHASWLYRELPGRELFGRRRGIHLAIAAVRAFSAIQKQARSSAQIESHVSGRCFDALGLFWRADALIQAAWQEVVRDEQEGALLAWNSARDKLLDVCRDVDRLGLPMTLTVCDLWPNNVLVTPGGIGFVDLGQGYWSYPFVSFWPFVNWVERELGGRGLVRPLIEQILVDEWAPVTSSRDMTRALSHLPTLGRLFAVQLESARLDRFERELGEPMIPGGRPDHFAPLVRKLAMTA